MDQMMKFLGELVVYGGGAVAIGFGLFKILGQKWLEAQFSERLQRLKAAQDEQLRHVQGFIDREIHRARKLYDREFDTLPEAWRLFCTSYMNGQATAAERYPDLSRFTVQELRDFLSTTTMRDYEKQELSNLSTSSWTEHFRRWSGAQRLQQYWKDLQAFRDFLNANAIFWSPGIKEKFIALDGLIGVAIAEMEQRLQMPEYRSFDQVGKLLKEGPPLRDELEEVIQLRLWSANLPTAAGDAQRSVV